MKNETLPYQSKRKNPDAYIEKLKKEIERTDKVLGLRLKDIRDLKAERGEHIFTYTDGGTRLEETVSLKHGKELEIGGQVKMTGRVTSLTLEGNKLDVSFRVGVTDFFKVKS